MTEEKSESCPRCNAIDDWRYDAQQCARCHHPDRYSEIMQAEQRPDMYGGPKCDQPFYRWVEDSRDGASEIGGDIRLDPRLFPPGTRVTIEVPLCPQCGEPREANYGHSAVCPPGMSDDDTKICFCGFDWTAWDARFT